MKKAVLSLCLLIFSLSLLTAQVKEKSLILGFSVNGAAADEIKKTREGFKITVTLPYQVDETALVARFETEEGVRLYVKDVLQESGTTANDFTGIVTYIAKNTTGLVQEYRVNVRFKPEFKMLIGASFHPSYYPQYQMLNLGANGTIMIGGKFDRFIFGGEFTENYFAFNGVYQNLNLSGFWNILRGMFLYEILLHKYFGLKWGIGGSWLYSKYEFNKKEIFTRSEPGLAVMQSFLIYPWKYIELEIFNRFDLFADVQQGFDVNNLYPYYLGGGRVTFKQFVKILRIFLDVSCLYSYYRNEQISNTNVMLVINAGISLDLQFPKLAKEFQKKRGKQEKTPAAPEQEKFIATKESLDELGSGKKGDIITFWEIEFEQGSSELNEKSKHIISRISTILYDNKSMKISLQTYSEVEDDPVASFTLSIERAKKVKQFLLELGISDERIFIPGEALILSDKEKKVMKYGIMKIEIINE